MNKNPTPPMFENSSIYVYPNIPEKKLFNAIKTYAENIKPEDVVLLLDNTVFGSAKEGLIITKDRFYHKYYSRVSWGDLRDFSQVTSNKSDMFFVNSEANIHYRIWCISSEKDTKLLAKYLFEFIEFVKNGVEEPKNITLITKESELVTENSPVNQSIHKSKKIVRNSELEAVQQPEVSCCLSERTDGINEPEAPYLCEEINSQPTKSKEDAEDNSVLGKFLKNNADGIIEKLKSNGLTLTASALQNDEMIIRVAGIIYNVLPGQIRFVVSLSTVETFLLNNRYWLIEKLK
ncbi:hypothetical protein A4G20_01290 [Pasteurellaceae bacterium RH1A]|nr:hypothetical protein A4G20_01290 [Pasteurellaceae bacterium RH1A]